MNVLKITKTNVPDRRPSNNFVVLVKDNIILRLIAQKRNPTNVRVFYAANSVPDTGKPMSKKSKATH